MAVSPARYRDRREFAVGAADWCRHAPNMGKPFSSTGGARIGGVNATWPLATISATADLLTIKAALLGSYSFQTDQVSSIERYDLIPVFGWGVQVRHCVAGYPERVIFWSLGNPENVLRGIREAGFIASAPAASSPDKSGFAIRWPVLIATVVIWNALFYLDFSRRSPGAVPMGPFVLAALALVCSLSIGTLSSSWVQRLVLKPDRLVGEVQPVLRLIAVVTGLLLVVLSVFFVTGFEAHG